MMREIRSRRRQKAIALKKADSAIAPSAKQPTNSSVRVIVIYMRRAVEWLSAHRASASLFVEKVLEILRRDTISPLALVAAHPLWIGSGPHETARSYPLPIARMVAALILFQPFGIGLAPFPATLPVNLSVGSAPFTSYHGAARLALPLQSVRPPLIRRKAVLSFLLPAL